MTEREIMALILFGSMGLSVLIASLSYLKLKYVDKKKRVKTLIFNDEDILDVIMGAAIPAVGYVDSIYLLEQALGNPVTNLKQYFRKTVKGRIYKANPELETIDVLDEIREIAMKETDVPMDKESKAYLSKMIMSLKNNHQNEVIKNLLANYDLTLKKMLAILNETKSLKTENKKKVYEEIGEILASLLKEVVYFEENIDKFKNQVETAVTKRFISELKAEKGTHSESYVKGYETLMILSDNANVNK